MNEEWRDVIGFEEYYEVSNLGNVKRKISQKILIGGADFLGYCKVSLYKETKWHTLTVHRLVAKAFIENPENKAQVHHINEIKTDNRACNLMWCTPKEHAKFLDKDKFRKSYKKNLEARKEA